jgi:pyruvate kinase
LKKYSLSEVKKMKRYILTVGPSLLKSIPISRIHDGRYIYRINGAHGSERDIKSYIEQIRAQVPGADILMDLPGNKIRTKDIGQINVQKGKEFEILNKNFNYPDFYKHLKKGMTVWANDSTLEFEVIDITDEKTKFLSKTTGMLIDNKGIHARDINAGLPFLYDKDRRLIEIANQYAISFVGLSFVRNQNDISEAKELIASGINVISKVETAEAIKNLNDILACVDYILIDRGDLSSEVSIINIPYYQNYIIEKALYFEKRIFLATQILKNMEAKPIPTIAEIDDLYNISKKGVYGIQLSEETAIGEYIEECISILDKVDRGIVLENVVL